MKYREVIALSIDDLPDGQMKQVSVEGTEILLVRQGDDIYAVGARCTHYGASLVDGVLCGHRVVCPWHQACFDVRTGALEDPPALDPLPQFPVRVENGNIVVQLPESVPDRARAPMASFNPQVDQRTYVLVGAGAAGLTAAQTLREVGFEGRIILITEEEQAPYDRPNLTKAFLTGEAPPEWMPLREDTFYEEHDIELWTGRKVTCIDALGLSVHFEDGERLLADELLIATGARPRKLGVEGENLPGVFTIRTLQQTEKLIDYLENAERAVIVGASFIGMESASSLRKRGIDVTVVAPETVPFAHTLGPEVGKVFYQLHSEQGVQFRMEHTVRRFHGDTRVREVELDNGERIPADVVIVGVGVVPVTEMVEGIPLLEDGSIPVNVCLCTGSGVFAAGDVAHFPDWRTGEGIRIEHWRTAQQQGRIAAMNMAGLVERFTSVPFFWTRQFDVSLQYVGHAPRWEEVCIVGSPEERDFVAYYVRKGKVYAAAGMGRSRELGAIEELMRQQGLLDVDVLTTVDSPEELLTC